MVAKIAVVMMNANNFFMNRPPAEANGNGCAMTRLVGSKIIAAVFPKKLCTLAAAVRTPADETVYEIVFQKAQMECVPNR
ncbi:MAG TPA: hypothetical protein VFZ40_14585 [Pyrinomonadaceae bacterium]